jgi:hypothetical protein
MASLFLKAHPLVGADYQNFFEFILFKNKRWRKESSFFLLLMGERVKSLSVFLNFLF